MPKLDHSGPEGKGPRSGRQLGRCKNHDEEASKGRLGEGLGKRRNADGCEEGKGKRLRSNLPK